MMKVVCLAYEQSNLLMKVDSRALEFDCRSSPDKARHIAALKTIRVNWVPRPKWLLAMTDPWLKLRFPPHLISKIWKIKLPNKKWVLPMLHHHAKYTNSLLVPFQLFLICLILSMPWFVAQRVKIGLCLFNSSALILRWFWEAGQLKR